jgi:hypothetical protein
MFVLVMHIFLLLHVFHLWKQDSDSNSNEIADAIFSFFKWKNINGDKQVTIGRLW